MLARQLLYFVSLTTLPTSLGLAQEVLQVRPPATAAPSPTAAATPAPEQTIQLSVPKGVPLEIALSENVRVKKAGQEIHGRVVRPVYAFDHLVLPAGTEVKGRIAKIDSISGKRRVFGILNGDFTPAHNVEVEFTEIQLPDGKRISFQAVITPGSGQPIQLVSAKDDAKKKGVVQDAAAKKVDEAKREARQAWQQAMKQVKEPGKVRRLEQYAMAQLPVRTQYLHSGTVYYAELEQPLDFGSEPLTPDLTSVFGAPLPPGSLVHALLATPLNSATTQKGAEVEAVLSQPLFDGERLVLPEGCRLKGSVVEVAPARRWHHNGQLRIVFRELVPPDGIEQRVVAGLESVQAGRSDHVKLDSEGGAEATSPRTRYASLALSLALTTAAFRQHTDADDIASSQSSNGVAGGIAGFKLVGMVIGFTVKSQPLGMAMGAYGSARSIYSTFIAKGREVVFPKNTPMEISLGSPRKPVLPTPQPGSSTAEPKR
jgi:type IV secretory pathway VirB10-like protein